MSMSKINLRNTLKDQIVRKVNYTKFVFEMF